jgi:hypothetical protein
VVGQSTSVQMGGGAPPLSDARLKHLELIQGVVTRMGTNSFLIKGWALTIAAAFLALLSTRFEPGLAAAGLIPVVAFWCLDGYFLAQERRFRRLYDAARAPDTTVDLMAMDTRAYRTGGATWSGATFSLTLIVFYGSFALLGVILVVVAAAT